MMNDKEAVELLVPLHMALKVLVVGAADPRYVEFSSCRTLLTQSMLEVVEGFPIQRRAKLMRRAVRAYDYAIGPFVEVSARTDRIGLILYFWLKRMISTGYLILPEGSKLDQALNLLLPALSHVLDEPELVTLAKRQTIDFLHHLHKDGLFVGVSMTQEDLVD